MTNFTTSGFSLGFAGSGLATALQSPVVRDRHRRSARDLLIPVELQVCNDAGFRSRSDRQIFVTDICVLKDFLGGALEDDFAHIQNDCPV